MANGRDAVAPLPAGGARERQLGWHAVPTLPEARYDAKRRCRHEDSTWCCPYPRMEPARGGASNSVDAEFGELGADMVDDFLELTVELEGVKGDAVVGV